MSKIGLEHILILIYIHILKYTLGIMLKQVCLRKNIRILIGRTDAEAPILWPPYSKSRLVGKDPHAGKVEGKRRRG